MPLGSGTLMLIDRLGQLKPPLPVPAAPGPAGAGPGAADRRQQQQGQGRQRVLAVYRLPPGVGTQTLQDFLEPAGRVDEIFIEPGHLDEAGHTVLVSEAVQGGEGTRV